MSGQKSLFVHAAAADARANARAGEDILQKIVGAIVAELVRAIEKHPTAFNSPHEGWAVIKEELDELWEHVKGDTGRSPDAFKEAIQIAAMAARYVVDLSE